MESDDGRGGGGFGLCCAGGVGFTDGEGVGRWVGGGGVGCVVLVFTTCGCWILCVLALSQGL